MHGITNYIESAYDSPLLLSLLGNKYFYLTEDFNNGIYEKIDSYPITSYNYEKKETATKDVYLFENPYALSIGYMIDSDVSYKEGMNLVDYQNAIIKAFTGTNDDVMIKLETETNNENNSCDGSNYPYCISYIIRNNTSNNIIYVYSPFSEYTIASNAKVYLDVNKPITIYTPDTNINLTLRHSSDLAIDKFIAATYDRNALIENLKKLQDSSLTDATFNKNKLTAKINAKKDGILFLSIPYDKNFKIYVDNQEANYYPLLDNTFIGINITDGEHDIKMVYENKAYIVYILSSIISIIITLILYSVLNRKIDIKNMEEEEKIKEQNKKRIKNKGHKKKKRK